ncbi:WD40 repeat-like protein [Artomyces pyxidatus]|uniref:WD40 repeat-like protein n=1 Tax=Artomyces pyxidatus TaxID=48021 RepID=A0ACB8T289_9AGAM|nr:WD40 repeat-like protein [Artomyces pyxidatus]
MLAVATPGHLTIADPSVLRRSPPSLSPTCDTSSSPVRTSTWSADNTSLYMASSHAISRYDTFGNLIKTVYEASEQNSPSQSIGTLITKDRGTLIFSRGSDVHILEHSASLTSSSKVVQTLLSHPDSQPVIALSLSNDGTLLAAASAGTVLIHNLSLNSHTALRGLPIGNDGGSISTCVLHPHSRVRLFLGIGRQLAVYDITRPTGPTRMIPMSDTASGDIVAVACSPYSKTLLAVACSDGYVALLDLDKDPGRIRSFHYQVGVTSLVFSADGASLYVGTDSGKLLVQTLRSVEAPKTIDVGGRVEALAISKKTKLGVEANAKTTGSVTSKPLTPQDMNSPRRVSGKIATSVLNASTTKSKLDKVASPVKRSSSTGDATETDSEKPLTGSVTSRPEPLVRKRVSSVTAIGGRKVSALKGIFAGMEKADDVSWQSESLTTRPIVRSMKDENPKGTVEDGATSTPSPIARKSGSQVSVARAKPLLHRSTVSASVPSSKSDVATPRTRTVSATSHKTVALSANVTPGTTQRFGSRTRTISAPKSPSSLAGKSPPTQPVRSRTLSTTSHPTGTGTITTRITSSPPMSVSSASRAASALSRATSSHSMRAGTANLAKQRTGMPRPSGSTTRERSPVPPVPRLSKVPSSESEDRFTLRTPSPDLPIPSPVILRDMAPPFPVIEEQPQVKRRGLAMLGLGTPEVERWIRGGGRKGKEIEAVKDDSKKVGFVGNSHDDLGELEDSRVEEVEEGADPGPPISKPRERPMSMQVTPRRPTGTSWAHSPLRHSVAGESPGVKGAQNLLHALISDAMLDFRQETKAEMVGLHLDLVRMGRSWRQEMRAAMSEYAADLRELREENRLLREENERLRRGY